MLKRKLSWLLCVLLVLSILVFPVSADAVPYGSFVPVGELRIYASNGESSGSALFPGHAFLTFTNLLTVDLTLGSYTVEPGEEITFGTFSSLVTPEEHSGIWYNLEAYKYHEEDDFTDSVSLCVTLDYIMYEELDDLIAVNDGYNVTTNNCVDFAVRIWNQITDDTLSGKQTEDSLSLPANLRDEIEDRIGEVHDRPLPDWEEVGYTQGGVLVPVYSK